MGGHLHADLIPLKTTSLDGHHVLLAAVDERSSYLTLVLMAFKTSKNIADAFEQIFLFYLTDNEEALRAVRPYFPGRGVPFTHTPADPNAEESPTSTGLPYQLPPELEAESYMYTAWTMNQTSSRTNAPATPY